MPLKQIVSNWTEFQRRIKHLLAVRLEFETLMEWIKEVMTEDHLKLIKLVKPASVTIPSYGQDFWSLDRDIQNFGIQIELLDKTGALMEHLDQNILRVLERAINEGTDSPLIEIKKHINKVLKNLYDCIICTCPWDGKITGGPMLPNQQIKVQMTDKGMYMIGRFEFLIIGARPADIIWLQDLKFPALSQTAQIWIQHGAKRELN